MSEKRDSDTQEKPISLLRKTNPNLVRLMNERIESMGPSPEQQKRMEQKMMAALLKRKGELAKEGKLNNSDWLKWLQPIILPIKQFEEWFRLQGFPVVDLRVAVAAITVIMFCFGGYYFVYKNNEEPVLISKNTDPTPKATGNLGSVERTFFGEGEGKELKEVKIILLRFSEDEKVLLLKEKIIDELKKGQLSTTDDPTKADAMLTVSSQNGQILMQLENVNEKVLWSKSLSSNETTFSLLEDLFLRIQKEKP